VVVPCWEEVYPHSRLSSPGQVDLLRSPRQALSRSTLIPYQIRSPCRRATRGHVTSTASVPCLCNCGIRGCDWPIGSRAMARRARARDCGRNQRPGVQDVARGTNQRDPECAAGLRATFLFRVYLALPFSRPGHLSRSLPPSLLCVPTLGQSTTPISTPTVAMLPPLSLWSTSPWHHPALSPFSWRLQVRVGGGEGGELLHCCTHSQSSPSGQHCQSPPRRPPLFTAVVRCLPVQSPLLSSTVSHTSSSAPSPP
jgi:hypothetical protein